ncbi:maternal protein exuperantia-like [Diachasma alloeum]|uniref:maternal protein exuperantia-like n=1 Tax=Diachasma alloeum TaxID=454923 RepID=UPI0007382ADF|nr:maternal protein exuperantia-like [Diachasma alloeum]
MSIDLPVDVAVEEAKIDGNTSVVIIDIETTGLLPTDSIIQIAAKCEDKEFSRFMFPTKKMHDDASKATGFTVREGKLYQYERILTTTPPTEAAEQFLAFLQQCGEKVLLVGHNIIRFDAPRIMRWLQQLGLLPRFCNYVAGVVDTLPLISQGKMKKQELLAKTYLTDDAWEEIVRCAHDALADCQILNGLLEYFKIGRQNLVDNSVSIKMMLDKLNNAKNKKTNVVALECLKSGKISTSMINKIATVGITMEKLREVYQKN